MGEIEYKHRNLKDAIFNLSCLAYIGVNDKTLIENLNADCERELALYEDLKKRYSKLYQVLEIISQNFELLGNCLHARNPYAERGWVFVKEIENEEELKAWEEVVLCQRKN